MTAVREEGRRFNVVMYVYIRVYMYTYVHTEEFKFIYDYIHRVRKNILKI